MPPVEPGDAVELPVEHDDEMPVYEMTDYDVDDFAREHGE
jgi:hypothetical protein